MAEDDPFARAAGRYAGGSFIMLGLLIPFAHVYERCIHYRGPRCWLFPVYEAMFLLFMLLGLYVGIRALIAECRSGEPWRSMVAIDLFMALIWLAFLSGLPAIR